MAEEPGTPQHLRLGALKQLVALVGVGDPVSRSSGRPPCGCRSAPTCGVLVTVEALLLNGAPADADGNAAPGVLDDLFVPP
jgi:hypothetical protein